MAFTLYFVYHHQTGCLYPHIRYIYFGYYLEVI